MLEQRLKKPSHTVALLAANPALTSILSMVLDADADLRVRAFSSPQELRTYMRVVGVALVVVDFDCEAAPAESLALVLRADENLANRSFRLIALTRTVDESTRLAARRTGMDEVIVKPMSPRFLLERVRALLGQPVADPIMNGAACPAARQRRRSDPFHVPPPAMPAHGGNVVPLFPQH